MTKNDESGTGASSSSIDREAVSAAAEGDRDALRKLATKVAPVVRIAVTRILVRYRTDAKPKELEHEAEDLAQEAFAALFDQGGRALKAWSPDEASIEDFVRLVAERTTLSILRSGHRCDFRESTTIPADVVDEDEERPHDRVKELLGTRAYLLFEKLFVEEKAPGEDEGAFKAELAAKVSPALVAAARADRKKTQELEARAREGTAAADDEEEIVRAVLAKGTDESLVSAALYAETRNAAPPSSAAIPLPAPSSRRGPISAPAPSSSSGPPSARGRASLASAPKPTSWAPVAIGALLVVAAIVLYVRLRTTDGALPGYEASLTGAEDKVVTRGAPIVLVARPRVPVEGPLEARAFAGCGAPLARVNRPVVVAATGAARIEGKPESIFGDTVEGPCSLAIAVARPGGLPDRFEDAAPSSTVRVDLVVKP